MAHQRIGFAPTVGYIGHNQHVRPSLRLTLDCLGNEIYLITKGRYGGACATGLGEAVIRGVGSHLVVELMRQGNTPQQACKLAVERIIKKHKDVKDLQIGFLALNKKGEYSSYCIHPGFNYAVYADGKNQLLDAEHAM